jgi:hypothetical protein
LIIVLEAPCNSACTYLFRIRNKPIAFVRNNKHSSTLKKNTRYVNGVKWFYDELENTAHTGKMK